VKIGSLLDTGVGRAVLFADSISHGTIGVWFSLGQKVAHGGS
jgi:hypothetical protein